MTTPSPANDLGESSQLQAAVSRGVLMPIGGAEDREGEKVVLRRFFELAGGSSSRIAVMPTASMLETTGQFYKQIFEEMGSSHVDVIRIDTRKHANDAARLEWAREATGIFLTGGNQLRLSVMIGGTLLENLVTERSQAGAVVAGTSAGASILSDHMVARGAGGSIPKAGSAHLKAGFGLISGVILDQHFRQRNRLGRLLALVASNPRLLGIGVDEDTAAIIGSDGILEVVGNHGVTIVDGSDMFSDFYRVPNYGEVSLANVKLAMLTSGLRYDLNARVLLPE
ncbi:MAG: cyanophycinase [Thermomicrobiales bacterium]|nr:cyanophycinase [Thermomicrobiales bacterium]MCO5219141.1 cyanophycinase [Thermomicrobiales bacterium]MCO5225441.1 cyanophycinase [Thermomicrobiales bacterium]MCO5228985.1 cyanophycinase [Thermomicrobiales bacterium]